MKKTVIKRRKRVPAAAGMSSARITDHQAAEALVGIGQSGGSQNANTGGEESDNEVEEPQPRRKRARRGKSDREKGRVREKDEDEDMGDPEDELPQESGGRGRGKGERASARKAFRDSHSSSWPEGLLSMHHQIVEALGDRSHSLPRVMQPGPELDHFAHHLGRVPSGHGAFIASPHPGLDLPPLNATLGERYGYGPPGLLGARDFGGALSSYVRSGSNAPSRTHSPLNPGLAAGVGYALPPPHVVGHGYYGLGHGHSPPPHDALNGVLTAVVPTMGELRQHYMELREQRRQWEEMMEKTDKMMAGLKREIDDREMMGAPQPAPQPSQPQAQPQHQAGLIIGTFVCSGFLHHMEVLLFKDGEGPWRLLVGFGMMGVVVLAERMFKQATGRKVGGVVGWIWTMGWLLVLGNFIIDAFARGGVFGHFGLVQGAVPGRDMMQRLVTNFDAWLHAI